MNKDYLEEVYKKIESEVENSVFLVAFPILLLSKHSETEVAKKIKDKHDLNHSELDVLLNLYKYGYIQTPTELYENMIFSSGGITKLLKKLEKRELISRVKSEEDKRSVLVKLEAKGAKLAADLMEILKEHHNGVYEILNKEERVILAKLLKKVLYGISDKEVCK